jgi:hypothetical protein
MRTAVMLRSECGSDCEESCMKNNFFPPKPAILWRRYESSEKPGKLRNIGKKQDGASQ